MRLRGGFGGEVDDTDFMPSLWLFAKSGTGGGIQTMSEGEGGMRSREEGGGEGEEACLWRGPCSNILRNLVRITMSIEPSSLQYDTEGAK